MTPDELFKVRTRFVMLREKLVEIYNEGVCLDSIELWSKVWFLIGAMKADLGLDAIDDTDPGLSNDRRGGLEPAERG
jgi:hypothetical protein